MICTSASAEMYRGCRLSIQAFPQLARLDVGGLEWNSIFSQLKIMLKLKMRLAI